MAETTMQTRRFGKTGTQVSEIGLGTWQLGARWGDPFDADEAQRILEAAEAEGINLIDTADVYNGGESERAIGRYLRERPDAFFVVTKSGRGLNPHVAEGYNAENLERFITGSLERLGTEALDVVLLHCPPSSVYERDDVFAALADFQKRGLIRYYGVSIEKISEGMAALDYDIAAIEVIFNLMRMDPADELFAAAEAADVGILARVPLASGLLTGTYTADRVFGEGDHRHYNRDGAAFDKGETFSGVPYELGLEAVAELQEVFGAREIAAHALRWVLMFSAVSSVIPGASRVEQVRDNVRAAALPSFTAEQMAACERIYREKIAPAIGGQWR